MLRMIMPLLLLVGSNLFMTYAWYGHLRDSFRLKIVVDLSVRSPPRGVLSFLRRVALRM